MGRGGAVTAVTGGDIFLKLFERGEFSPKTNPSGPSLVPGWTMCMMLGTSVLPLGI